MNKNLDKASLYIALQQPACRLAVEDKRCKGSSIKAQ